MYRQLVVVLSLTTVGLGVAMVAVAASRGGVVGYLLGVLFIAAGGGRLYLLRRR